MCHRHCHHRRHYHQTHILIDFWPDLGCSDPFSLCVGWILLRSQLRPLCYPLPFQFRWLFLRGMQLLNVDPSHLTLSLWTTTGHGS
jgi:hypothetical protein